MALGGMSTATLLLVLRAQNATGPAFASVGKGLAALPAMAGVAALGMAAASVKMATDFQNMTTKLANNTTMGAKGLVQMRQTITTLASSSAAPLDQLAQGYMHITNFGFGASDATTILTAAMKSAVSTGSSVADTANILAQAMHEYGLRGSEAGHAMDVLHLAAAQGNATLQQFVEGGSKAISMAANLGISLTQVTGALSALSRHESLPQASTQIVGMLSKIVNPAVAAQKELASLTLKTNIPLLSDFSPQGLKARGLPGVLSDVRKATGGNAQEIYKLIPALRGGLGAQIMTGTGKNDYSTILASLNKTMAGGSSPTATAYAQIQKTLGNVLGTVRNQVQLLAIALGTKLLPAVTKGASVVSALLAPALRAVQNPSAALRTEVGRIATGVAALVLGLAAYRAISLSVTATTAAWTVVSAVATAGVAAYTAVNNALALAVLAVRVGLVGETVQTVASTVATTAARVATVLWTAGMEALQLAVLAARTGGILYVAQIIATQVAMVAVRAATLVWTAAQWALNVALDANPLGLVTVAIAALVAGVIWAYKNVGWFHDAVNAVWKFLSGVFGPEIGRIASLIGQVLGGALQGIINLTNTLLDGLGHVLAAFGKMVGIKISTTSAHAATHQAVSAARNAIPLAERIHVSTAQHAAAAHAAAAHAAAAQHAQGLTATQRAAAEAVLHPKAAQEAASAAKHAQQHAQIVAKHDTTIHLQSVANTLHQNILNEIKSGAYGTARKNIGAWTSADIAALRNKGYTAGDAKASADAVSTALLRSLDTAMQKSGLGVHLVAAGKTGSFPRRVYGTTQRVLPGEGIGFGQTVASFNSGQSQASQIIAALKEQITHLRETVSQQAQQISILTDISRSVGSTAAVLTAPPGAPRNPYRGRGIMLPVRP